MIKLSLLAMLALAACSSKSMPTEAAAKQARAAHAAKIERIEGVIATELGRDTLEGAGATKGQVLADRADAVKDLVARLRGALATAITEAGALGIQVRLHEGAKRDRPFATVHLPPCPPDHKSGSTEPRDGLGWGLYRTAYEDDTGKHGTGDYHPGFIAVSEVVANAITAEVVLCFLTDGTPAPAR